LFLGNLPGEPGEPGELGTLDGMVGSLKGSLKIFLEHNLAYIKWIMFTVDSVGHHCQPTLSPEYCPSMSQHSAIHN